MKGAAVGTVGKFFLPRIEQKSGRLRRPLLFSVTAGMLAAQISKNTVSLSPCIWTLKRYSGGSPPSLWAISVPRRSAGTRPSTGSGAVAAAAADYRRG